MNKSRSWQTIFWTDNKNDFLDYLKKSGVCCAISPCHDKDVKVSKEDYDRDPDNKYGEFKRPHFHALFFFPGPTTYKVVCSFLEPISCANSPVICFGPVGAYWYHIHRYDPDKHLYNDSDRTLINGLDKSQFEQLTENQNFELKCYFHEVIIDNNMIRLEELFEYVDRLFRNNRGEIDQESGELKELKYQFTYDQMKNFIFNNLFFVKSFLNDNYQKISKPNRDYIEYQVDKILKERNK